MIGCFHYSDKPKWRQNARTLNLPDAGRCQERISWQDVPNPVKYLQDGGID